MEVFIGLMIIGVFCWRLIFLASLLIVCALAKSLGVRLDRPFFVWAHRQFAREEQRLQARRGQPTSHPPQSPFTSPRFYWIRGNIYNSHPD